MKKEFYGEIFIILKKLLNHIYNMEANTSLNVVNGEDFQLHRLNPPEYLEVFDRDNYPVYYYRDDEGNEIVVTNKNGFSIKLKDKVTVSSRDLESFSDEDLYLSLVLEKLKKEEKVLIRK